MSGKAAFANAIAFLNGRLTGSDAERTAFCAAGL